MMIRKSIIQEKEEEWSNKPPAYDFPPFSLATGPKNIPVGTKDPVDYFRLLWPLELDEFLVEATNSRILQKTKEISPRLVTVNEMSKYLAVLCFNGVLGLKSWEMVFSENGKYLIVLFLVKLIFFFRVESNFPEKTLSKFK